LRISIAIVALYSDTLGFIEQRGTERTGNDTGLASDTLVFIYNYPIQFRVFMTGFGRADFDTEGIFAILACHREIYSFPLPFVYFNPGATGVTGSGVKNGACQFTFSASRTFFMVDI
jgi:hypothetical protein